MLAIKKVMTQQEKMFRTIKRRFRELVYPVPTPSIFTLDFEQGLILAVEELFNGIFISFKLLAAL